MSQQSPAFVRLTPAFQRRRLIIAPAAIGRKRLALSRPQAKNDTIYANSALAARMMGMPIKKPRK